MDPTHTNLTHHGMPCILGETTFNFVYQIECGPTFESVIQVMAGLHEEKDKQYYLSFQ